MAVGAALRAVAQELTAIGLARFAQRLLRFDKAALIRVRADRAWAQLPWSVLVSIPLPAPAPSGPAPSGRLSPGLASAPGSAPGSHAASRLAAIDGTPVASRRPIDRVVAAADLAAALASAVEAGSSPRSGIPESDRRRDAPPGATSATSAGPGEPGDARLGHASAPSSGIGGSGDARSGGASAASGGLGGSDGGEASAASGGLGGSEDVPSAGAPGLSGSEVEVEVDVVAVVAALSARDAQWRGALPPEAARVAEVIPAALLVRAAEAAADTLRALTGKAGERAIRDALLDHQVITGTSDLDGSSFAVSQRVVQAMIRMGFVTADPVEIRVTGPWTGLASSEGEAWYRQASQLSVRPIVNYPNGR